MQARRCATLRFLVMTPRDSSSIVCRLACPLAAGGWRRCCCDDVLESCCGRRVAFKLVASALVGRRGALPPPARSGLLERILIRFLPDACCAAQDEGLVLHALPITRGRMQCVFVLKSGGTAAPLRLRERSSFVAPWTGASSTQHTAGSDYTPRCLATTCLDHLRGGLGPAHTAERADADCR